MSKKKIFIAGALMTVIGATIVESVRRYANDNPTDLDDLEIESVLPVEVRLGESAKWEPAKLFLGRKLDRSKAVVVESNGRYKLYNVSNVTGCIPGTESITLSFNDSFGTNRCVAIRFEEYEPSYEIEAIKEFCSTLD